MTKNMTLIAIVLLLVVTGLFAVARKVSEEKVVDLNHFEWTISKIRSETSVKRHPATCAFTWGPDKEDFKPERGTLSIITITLKAKKTGRLKLTPELFLMSDRNNFHLCHGVRVVTPKPGCGEAFFPPSGGSGLEIYKLNVKAGQSIVIELVFAGQLREGEQILAASPAATRLKP